MRKEHFTLLFLLFTFVSLTAQSTIDIQQDTTVVAINDTPPTIETPVKRSSFWQVSKYSSLTNSPDNGGGGKVEFEKGKDFIELKEDGTYSSLFNKSFGSGYWIQNQNLIVLKQKVPKVIEVYYEVVLETADVIKLKKGDRIIELISKSHPSYVKLETSESKIIPNQGFSFTSL